jgi:hypothetical protein
LMSDSWTVSFVIFSRISLLASMCSTTSLFPSSRLISDLRYEIREVYSVIYILIFLTARQASKHCVNLLPPSTSSLKRA